jgi:hypothetical protein
LLDILFSILRKNHDEVTAEDHVTYETTAEQAALLWQKLELTHLASIISTRKLRVS